MAIRQLEQEITRLGNELAQQHYGTTSDYDGPLPQSPTDADRVRLVELLGRGGTLEEERAFEAGYRESMLRLDGNALSTRHSSVMLHELFATLARWGYAIPMTSTPEYEQVELAISRMLVALRETLAALGRASVPTNIQAPEPEPEPPLPDAATPPAQ